MAALVPLLRVRWRRCDLPVLNRTRDHSKRPILVTVWNRSEQNLVFSFTSWKCWRFDCFGLLSPGTASEETRLEVFVSVQFSNQWFFEDLFCKFRLTDRSVETLRTFCRHGEPAAQRSKTQDVQEIYSNVLTAPNRTQSKHKPTSQNKPVVCESDKFMMWMHCGLVEWEFIWYEMGDGV